MDEDKLSPVYELALEVADPYGRGEGGVSVTVLARVLSSSSLGSAEVERVSTSAYTSTEDDSSRLT